MAIETFDFRPAASLLYPLDSPFRNILPRWKETEKEFKSVVSIHRTSNMNHPFMIGVEDGVENFQFLSKTKTVTTENIWMGSTFEHIRDKGFAELLRKFMVEEDRELLTGAGPEAAVGYAPDLAIPTFYPEGGMLNSNTTLFFKQTVFTPAGESLPSRNPVAFHVPHGTGGRGYFVLHPVPPRNRPVLAYRFYIAYDAKGPYHALGTHAVEKVYSSIPGCHTNGQAVKMLGEGTDNVGPPLRADGSYRPDAFNGLYTQLMTRSGATVFPVNGPLQTTFFEDLFRVMWDAGAADPEIIMANPVEADAMGFHSIVNRITARNVSVIPNDHVPQGVVFVLSMQRPGWYVPVGIEDTMSVACHADYTGIMYPPTAEKSVWELEVRTYSSFRLRVPVLQGVLTGISSRT